MDAAHVAKLKVVELREELARRGLDTKGLKKDLVERLTAALENGEGDGDKADDGGAGDEGNGVAQGGGGDADERMEQEKEEVEESEGDKEGEKHATDADATRDATNGDHDMDADVDVAADATATAPADVPADPKPELQAMDEDEAPAAPVKPADKQAIDPKPAASPPASPPPEAMDTDEPRPPVMAPATSDAALPPSLSHLASSYPPSTILYIANLRRPLLLSALHAHAVPTALPSATATLPFSHADYPGLWLSGVKDHAYAGYTSTAAALEAAERIHGAVWPDGGAALDVQFVDPAQVADLIAKEEAAWGRRQRLVLSAKEEGGGWVFDVVPPTSGAGEGRRPSGLANAAPVPVPGPAGQAGQPEQQGRLSLADRMGARPAPTAAPAPSSTTTPSAPATSAAEAKLGPVRRTRAQPSLEYCEGPGAPERKRRGARGGRGRRSGRGRGGGDSYHPGGEWGERERGGDRFGGGRGGRFGDRGDRFGGGADRFGRDGDRYVPPGAGGANGPGARRERGQERFAPYARRGEDRWRR